MPAAVEGNRIAADLTREGLRETLCQIIREELNLLQLVAEPTGDPTPGKLSIFIPWLCMDIRHLARM